MSGRYTRFHALTYAIGARIKGARTAAGISGNALGRAVGLSVGQISRYENGANAPSAEVLCLLALTLGVETRDLLPDIAEVRAIMKRKRR